MRIVYRSSSRIQIQNPESEELADWRE